MVLSHNHFYILGIKGAAMVHIAAMLKHLGKNVTGADVEEIFPTDVILDKNKIEWQPFSKAKLPAEIEVVVYAAGHEGKNNPLVKEAEKRGVQVVHQAELLGELLSQFEISLAVAGCHGKTTTSSMLAYALIKLNKQPSYLVGTPSFNDYEGSALGEGEKEYFVIEADEYALHPPEDKTPKFHHLKPTNVIITNIDFDHPDVFKDLEDTKKAFEVFMNNVSSTNDAVSLVLCADDENVMDVARKVQLKSRTTYGISEDAKFRAHSLKFDKDKTSFTISYEDEQIGRFSIKLPGEKSVVNATGVITMLTQLGFTPEEIQPAIEGFIGAKRRFEHIETVGDVDLFDDYAHHPNELKAIIQATKSRFPGRPLRLVFQPHTFSRTQALSGEFIDVLKTAATAIILPVFASAREQKPIDAFDNTKLVEVAKTQNIHNLFASQTEEEAIAVLKEHVSGNDIIITAGAGDIYKLQPAILSMLKS